MNMGLKFVDDQRLDRIDVKFENDVVVQYEMDYNQNHETGKAIDGSTRFFKTLLTEISEKRNGKTFYSHKMDYHQGEYGFSQTPDQVIGTSVLAPFLGGAPEWTQDFLGDVVAHVMPSPLSNSLTKGRQGGSAEWERTCYLPWIRTKHLVVKWVFLLARLAPQGCLGTFLGMVYLI